MPLVTPLGPDAGEETLLKKKFRELDRNRDGMLNLLEFTNLLQQGGDKFDDSEVKMLFAKVDYDNTGKIKFDEFVDYVFGLREKKEVTRKQEVSMQVIAKSREMWAEVWQVEMCGCVVHAQMNGVYEKGDEINGFASYDRGYPQCSLFYGWTEGRKKVGWFMARIPPQSGAVQRYKMFNPSPDATAPHLCYSTWEVPDGRRDKRMFVTGVSREEFDPECMDGTAEPDELWEGLPEGYEEEEDEYGGWEASEMADDEEEAWEMEWMEEAGEGVDDTDDLDDSAYTSTVEIARDPTAGPSELFEDDMFPPGPVAVGEATRKSRRSTPKASSVKVTGWKRLHEIHDNPCLFQTVVPEDIIGDATAVDRWFLCACATVAEYPAWISSMFGKTKNLDKAGRYQVRLYHPGKKSFINVEVDDFVPMKDDAPAFAGISFEGELWPALIEKAFAKLCGSYKNMEWGACAYGMLYLCGGGGAEVWNKGKSERWHRSYTVWKGKTSDTIDRKRAEGMVADGVDIDEDKFWSILREYMEFGYPVACSIGKAEESNSGLLSDWTYTLIAAREVPVEGQTLRLLRLRNPFGAGDWKGRWSDDSDAWEACPVAKNDLKFTPRRDGTFWISLHDFLTHFEQIEAVKKAMPVQGCRPSKIAGMKRSYDKREPRW